MPGEAGIGLAAEKLYERLPENVSHLRNLKDRLSEKLAAIPGAHINGLYDERSAPHILSARFDGIRSEVLLHALEEKGIYVSSGSACSSDHPSEITTLLSIGLPKEEQEGTIRFSFSSSTTEEDIDRTAEELAAILPVLRRFKRR